MKKTLTLGLSALALLASAATAHAATGVALSASSFNRLHDMQAALNLPSDHHDSARRHFIPSRNTKAARLQSKVLSLAPKLTQIMRNLEMNIADKDDTLVETSFLTNLDEWATSEGFRVDVTAKDTANTGDSMESNTSYNIILSWPTHARDQEFDNAKVRLVPHISEGYNGAWQITHWSCEHTFDHQEFSKDWADVTVAGTSTPTNQEGGSALGYDSYITKGTAYPFENCRVALAGTDLNVLTGPSFLTGVTALGDSTGIQDA